LAAKLAITLEACHAVDVLQEAFRRYDTPKIVNTDQSSQFTAQVFVDAVKNQGCQLSMDGQGALAGQCLRRTLMALGEIRMRLFPCLRFGGSSQNIAHAVRGVVHSLKTTFQPGWKNALSSLYRSVATGQNGSVIIGRDFTLKSMIAVQRFRATSVCIVPAHWNKVKSTRNAL
jgi:hypothetical protein